MRYQTTLGVVSEFRRVDYRTIKPETNKTLLWCGLLVYRFYGSAGFIQFSPEFVRSATRKCGDCLPRVSCSTVCQDRVLHLCSHPKP